MKNTKQKNWLTKKTKLQKILKKSKFVKKTARKTKKKS